MSHLVWRFVYALCSALVLVLCRIKSYILKRQLMTKLMKPVECRQKWLVIAAIRFLRTCISMKDEFYYRYSWLSIQYSSHTCHSCNFQQTS